MFVARPSYLVFAVDRFDLVMANMLTDDELAKASPPYDRRPLGKPPTVGARAPCSERVRVRVDSIVAGSIMVAEGRLRVACGL